MPMFKLSPKQLDHPNWDASTSKSPETIEADNEDKARKKLSKMHSIATCQPKGENVRESPWLDPALVDCVKLAE